jgi:hypothetical protein
LCVLLASSSLRPCTFHTLHYHDRYFLDMMLLCITQKYAQYELSFNILATGIKYTISTVSLKVFIRNITVLSPNTHFYLLNSEEFAVPS